MTFKGHKWLLCGIHLKDNTGPGRKAQKQECPYLPSLPKPTWRICPPLPAPPGSARLEASEGEPSVRGRSKSPTEVSVRTTTGHFRLLLPKDRQAQGGVTILAGKLTLIWKEVQPQFSRIRRWYIWHLGDPLEHLGPPLSCLKVNEHMQQPWPEEAW